MESILSLILPAFLGVVLVRLLLYPLGWAARLALHSAGGFLCLWLLNLVSGITGLTLPINAVTVLTAGTLGLPGIGGIALLALLP